MKLSITMIFLALLFAGCSKQSEAEREAHEKTKPGYQAASSFCSQCHALPFTDQHPPAAWPYVVSRMEGYMESAHKHVPNAAEHEAILAYFQSN